MEKSKSFGSSYSNLHPYCPRKWLSATWKIKKAFDKDYKTEYKEEDKMC